MKTNQTFNSLYDFIKHYVIPNWKKPNPTAIFLMVVGGLILFALIMILFTALIRWLWGWVVPDLFPNAVASGTLTGTLSWWTAFKVFIALVIITSLFKGSSSKSHHSEQNTMAAPAQHIVEPSQAAAVEDPNRRVFPALVDPLTDRELEVLELLARGLTNQQIALQLDVSESTVVYHIGHIFGKLRVGSRVEAAVWAKERGII